MFLVAKAGDGKQELANKVEETEMVGKQEKTMKSSLSVQLQELGDEDCREPAEPAKDPVRFVVYF